MTEPGAARRAWTEYKRCYGRSIAPVSDLADAALAEADQTIKMQDVELLMALARAEQAEAEVERLKKRLAVLDDLGYDPEVDSITIHRDGAERGGAS
jgi:hypothetical protein